jgi:uncharacterized membrane protein
MEKEAKRGRIFLIAGYKLLAGALILLLGLLILYFNCDINQLDDFFIKEGIEDKPHDIFFSYLLDHLNPKSAFLNYFGTFCLILFGILEIFFSITLMRRKKWGAVGLFIVSFVWLFFALFFVSRFLVMSKEFSIGFDIIILFLLFDLIYSSKKYFK